MEKNVKVTKCYHSCPFFRINGNVMECGHPYFDDKDPYDSCIIMQNNSRDGKFPNECPLFLEPLTINYSR